ncbi:MAG: hypothetical protein LBF82_00965 [Lactobacillales bacterium]|jgi:uncharacterized membrane protein YhaH (DUF805 family)|nr:hypothetical protein [Lactobacillales bacterium]
MNEVQEKNFKRLKLVNMITLVITAISTVLSLIGLPVALNPSIYKSKAFGEKGAALYEAFNQPFVKIFACLSVVLTVIFLIFLFLANKKIKAQELPKKNLYYIYLLVSAIQLVYNLSFAPKNNSGNNSIIKTIITTLVLNLPAILAIVYIFKLENEEVGG